MPDPLSRRSALTRVPQPGDLIQERRELWIQRLYAPDRTPGFGGRIGLDLPEQANGATFDNDLHALRVAPGEWLLVSEKSTDRGNLFARIAEADGALSDLSHGRTVFRIAAAAALEILAKSCPLDLSAAAFSPGHCAQSVLAGVPMLTHYLEDGAHVDIYVARGFGQFMHDWLNDAA